MALEELSTTMSKLSFNIFGSESEKKMGAFLFNEKVDWATSRELHGLAALTFNERECAGVMAVVGKALEPKDHTWKTILKAVRLLHHFVLYGAERCVDHAWDHQRRVEELRRYNSAIHGRTGALNGGGRDFGAPVRKAAEELDDLLKDSDAIREAREEGRTPDALLPMGAPDDYKAPVKPKGIDLGIDDAFGIVPEGSMGAKFDLQQVPGMYEGRPDRYFDDKADPRKRTQEIEDSDYTRQALAPDLLDLDIGEVQPATTVPESQDLVRANKEAALQQQLLAQQQQLEQLKILMLSKGQQGGGVSGGGGAGAGSMSNMPAMGGGPATAKADKVMEAFGSMGRDDMGGTPAGGSGAGGMLHQQQGAGGIALSMKPSNGGMGGGFMGGGGVGQPGLRLGQPGLVASTTVGAGGGGSGLGQGALGSLGVLGGAGAQMQQQQQPGAGGMGGVGLVPGGMGGGIPQGIMMGGAGMGQRTTQDGLRTQQQQQQQQFRGQS